MSSKPTLNLLVADDDHACRESLVEFLLREGYRVRDASHGQEALALLRSWRVDLSVMDVNMPGMTGPEVLQKFAAEARGKLPPTVFTSSDHTVEAHLHHLLDLPVSFVPKPIKLDALRRSMLELLRAR